MNLRRRARGCAANPDVAATKPPYTAAIGPHTAQAFHFRQLLSAFASTIWQTFQNWNMGGVFLWGATPSPVYSFKDERRFFRIRTDKTTPRQPRAFLRIRMRSSKNCTLERGRNPLFLGFSFTTVVSLLEQQHPDALSHGGHRASGAHLCVLFDLCGSNCVFQPSTSARPGSLPPRQVLQAASGTRAAPTRRSGLWQARQSPWC
jgi:hypothetical protein